MFLNSLETFFLNFAFATMFSSVGKPGWEKIWYFRNIVSQFAQVFYLKKIRVLCLMYTVSVFIVPLGQKEIKNLCVTIYSIVKGIAHTCKGIKAEEHLPISCIVLLYHILLGIVFSKKARLYNKLRILYESTKQKKKCLIQLLCIHLELVV